MTISTGRRRSPSARKPLSSQRGAGAIVDDARQAQKNTGEIISYIAELTEELAHLARSINQDSLAYFLTMARAEAELIALGRIRK